MSTSSLTFKLLESSLDMLFFTLIVGVEGSVGSTGVAGRTGTSAL